MRDVDKWADFVKNNPDKWRPIHTEFINNWFKKRIAYYDRLRKTKGGKEKIIEIFGINNKKIIERL